jgi:TPR repeat protein
MSHINAAALHQFETAARAGQAQALYNLGLVYSTENDYVTAHKWFNLAAMKGIDEARKMRADLSREMSPSEIAEAQRQAREWLIH